VLEDSQLEGVAIIGMAGRFPGARNLAELWSNLCDGVESVTTFTVDELIEAGVDPKVFNDENYVKAGTRFEGADLFDAAFFNYSPREAEIMDPQHRIYLECSHEALENAGYDPETYKGLIGVYAGSTIGSYLTHHLSLDSEVSAAVGKYQLLLGNDKDFVPTRVSYKLNLKGPSINVQTACSTSLVAVHLACQSLLNGECDIALAGGVSVRFPLHAGYHYQDEGILSPDGHCRTFDANAAGTVGGNGVGIVVLKRLYEAVEDGDVIHAVIKGSAINNDGSLKVGYTAPSVDGQASVISSAHVLAGVDARTISYIEAHGTGTLLGDPIEIAALTQAFRVSTQDKSFCAIGSIKTNLGHCDAAAGIAGLLKAAMSIRNRKLVPSLNFNEPNPRIDFEHSPFYVNTKLTDWNSDATPLRAGVSSFGIGGTNAHVILEEAPAQQRSSESRSWQLLTLSAKTKSALEQATLNLVEFLKTNSDPKFNLADVAYTLNVGRTSFNQRRTILCRDAKDALDQLQTKNSSRVSTSTAEPQSRNIVFMFPGQGSQHFQMGRGLYEREAFFRTEVDKCSELLIETLKCDSRELIFTASNDSNSESQLKQTAFAQPALFVIEYALARLLMSWGIEPQAMVGHSIGEYVAATLSGVINLEDALKLVATRGRLMQSLPEGSMLAVSLPERDVVSYLDEDVSVAAINSPSLCVLSGSSEAIDKLEKQLVSGGISCNRLHTSHAFHSAMMEPILEQFAREVRSFDLSAPRIPYLSNLTGKWITPQEATDSNYWAAHLRNAVRFSDNVAELLTESDRVFLEVGPGQTLSTLVRQHPTKAESRVVLSSMRHPKDDRPDDLVLLSTLAQLWLNGTSVDWERYYADERRRRVQLPTYPFERKRFWIDPRVKTNSEQRAATSLHRKPKMGDWFYVPSWKQSPVPRKKAERQQSRYLIFVDGCGLGEKLILRLRQMDLAVTAIEIGSHFKRLSDDRYSLNPGHKDDYLKLFSELRDSNRLPDRIVHMWSVSGLKELDHEGLIQERGFLSLISLAQAIGEIDNSHEFQLEIVSSSMHRIAGQEEAQPEKSSLLGACKTIPQEFENITCRSIDVSLVDVNSACSSLVDALLAEFDLDADNTPIAYRSGDRWVRTFQPVPLNDLPNGADVIREGGVYLITGGMGGIGLELAAFLSKEYRAKLILIGRSKFPAREEWQQWLDQHEQTDPTSQRIRHLQQLEGFGGQFLVLRADVSDRESMEHARRVAETEFGTINGVIHAAGLPGGGLIQLKSQQSALETLAPKVDGTLILESLFANDDLDFFVVCSSLVSLLGGSSHVDYCAANSFLDSFAQSRRNHPKRCVVSINWNMWRDTGMAGNNSWPEDFVELRRRMQEYGISAEEGVEVFRRVLASHLPQVAISTQDFTALMSQKDALMSDWKQVSAKSQTSPAHSRPDLSTPYVAPATDVETRIAGIWEELLGIREIGLHDNFFQLGGHSLLGTRLISRLHDAFEISITLRKVFEVPTIAGLATAVEETRNHNDEKETLQLLQLLEQLADEDIDAELAKRLPVV